MNFTQEQMLAQIENVEKEQGKEVADELRKTLARKIMVSPGGEAWVRRVWPNLPFDELKLEASRDQTVNHAMLGHLQQRVPSLKTQAQFNLFAQTTEGLLSLLELGFAKKESEFKAALDVFVQLLNTAIPITIAGEQVAEVPEAATGPLAETLTAPPKELEVHADFKALLSDLDGIESQEQLQMWYNDTTQKRNSVAGEMRDKLFDAIRKKKLSLT